MEKFVESGHLPTLDDCYCLHPKWILNPKLAELLIKFGSFHYAGRFHHIHLTSYHYYDSLSYLFKPREQMTVEEAADCYVIDESSGETFPIFFLVPCGSCLLCADVKLKRFANKCLMESQCYKFDPLHITLTYDEAHLPEGGNLCYDDICKFKKRFRQNLIRHGYTDPIRIVDSSEYGEKNGRPHYHLIVWNLDCSKDIDFVRVRHLCYLSWRKCASFVLRNGFRLINQDYIPKGQTKSLRQLGISSNKVFEYVGAYVGCPQPAPEGKVQPWVHCSKGKLGGIGAPFLDKNMSKIRRLKRTSFKFRDYRSGELCDLVYDRYVLNRCFPSKYVSVPYKLRKAVTDFARILPLLPERPGISNYGVIFEKLYEAYSPYFFIPRLTLSEITHLNDMRTSVSAMSPGAAEVLAGDYLLTISRYWDRDFSHVLELDDLRKVVLFHLFRHKTPRDRIMEVYKLKLKNYAKARSRSL